MKSVLIKVKTLLALLLLIPSLSWGEFENLNEDISVIGKKLICFNNSTGSVFGLDFKNGIPKDGREIGFLDFAYMNENHSSLDKFFTLYYQADFSFIQFEIPYDSSDNKLLELPQFAMSLDRNNGFLALTSPFHNYLGVQDEIYGFECKSTKTNNVYYEMKEKHNELVDNLLKKRKF